MRKVALALAFCLISTCGVTGAVLAADKTDKTAQKSSTSETSSAVKQKKKKSAHKKSAHKVSGKAQTGKSNKSKKTAHVASASGKSNKMVVHVRSSQLARDYGVKVQKASYAPALGSAGNVRLESSAALVFDESTQEALLAKNDTAQLPIASITKLMTAMVVLDSKPDMQETLRITEQDVDTLRHSSSRLAVGSELPRSEMLKLALMSSENRAASSLARSYPGGLPAFVAAMNRKAEALGMSHTHFVDSTGLNSSNMSTAQDLVKMVSAAYRYEKIRDATTTTEHDVYTAGRNLAYNNTNALVKSQEWDIGLSKTGFIKEAGRCLVMQARIAARPVIIVLLDSVGKYSRIGDAQRIKSWLERESSGHMVSLDAPRRG